MCVFFLIVLKKYHVSGTVFNMFQRLVSWFLGLWIGSVLFDPRSTFSVLRGLESSW